MDVRVGTSVDARVDARLDVRVGPGVDARVDA